MTVVECEKELESSNSFSEGEGLEEQLTGGSRATYYAPGRREGCTGYRLDGRLAKCVVSARNTGVAEKYRANTGVSLSRRRVKKRSRREERGREMERGKSLCRLVKMVVTQTAVDQQ